MSLRLKINLIMVAVITSLVLTIIGLQIDGLRRSVREEVAAANLVAAQLLNRVGWVYAMDGMPTLVQFLQQLGRVRANDITLTDAEGTVLYQSPHSAYKAGRDAPAWFQSLLLPASARQVISLPRGQLTIEANPSRAILDGWDDLVRLAATGTAALLVINLLVFWAMGRALRPFRQIIDALHRLQAGDFSVALPPLPGKEAAEIGAAFNRMTAVLKDNIDTHRRAFEAERQLSDSRQLSRLIETHVETERREIARALHDELGQSVTAIRSLATSVARRCDQSDAATAQAARVISEEAGRLYDHMHGMIPRLAPMALDQLGLADALRDLLDRVEAAHPDARVTLAMSQIPDPLADAAALAAYRVVQEGLTNALRHGHATEVTVTVGGQQDALDVTVQDNGSGLQGDWRQSGHFGLRWLHERVESLGGKLTIANAPPQGALLHMSLPVGAPT